MIKVAIIGTGEIGQAIAHVIKPHAKISTWSRALEAESPATHSLERVVRGAAVVFLCVPSWAIREVAAKVATYISSSAVVVSLAKGLESPSHKTMDEVLKTCFVPNQPIAVLGGPLLAEELLADLPGIGVLASRQRMAFDTVRPLFEKTSVRLEYSPDSKSVALAAVLKNVYAFGLGIAEGLGWGLNGKSWLLSLALAEMQSITAELGGDGTVVLGAAGMGDLLATSLSTNSRNHAAGMTLAQTGTLDEKSEGLRSLTSVMALLNEQAGSHRFLMVIDRVARDGVSAKTAYTTLLA